MESFNDGEYDPEVDEIADVSVTYTLVDGRLYRKSNQTDDDGATISEADLVCDRMQTNELLTLLAQHNQPALQEIGEGIWSQDWLLANIQSLLAILALLDRDRGKVQAVLLHNLLESIQSALIDEVNLQGITVDCDGQLPDDFDEQLSDKLPLRVSEVLGEHPTTFDGTWLSDEDANLPKLPARVAKRFARFNPPADCNQELFSASEDSLSPSEGEEESD